VATSTPIGERIAYCRRRRGLSQVKLAGLLGRSESWLSQVERGARSIDRISVLIEIAAVLNVPVTDLTPEPLIPRRPEEHPTVRAIRTALNSSGSLYLRLTVASEDKAGRAPDLGDLQAQANQAWELTHASRFADLEGLLPTLIVEAEMVARTLKGPERKAAFRILSEIYQATAAVMAKLRQTDLGWVAAERSISAAEHADAPLHAAAGAFRLSHVFLSGNHPDEALQTARSSAQALEDAVSDGQPELIALWGALSLAGAVAAIRARNEEAGRECMGKAEEAARRLEVDDNDYFNTEFGPANVALHAVSVAVELGDAGEALKRAETVDASKLSLERRARFLIDVARAYGQRRKASEAVRALEEAEGYAPEEVRSNPFVHQLVRDLLRGERRRPNPNLRALGRRAGALP
jgi:transcriptional regulator with XRE-family HTH domain